jgi:hypothetical protein
MEIKEYVVILKKGIDYNQVWADIENPTTGLSYIPDRPVNITNSVNAFDRFCIYALTDEEAEKLRQDPRVQAVEIPIEKMPGIEIVPFATQNPATLTPPGNFNKPTLSNDPNINWGLIRHSNNSNVYGSEKNTSLNYNYVLDGTGVDVVISDTGIQADHPEFTDANGVSRVQQINWATYEPNLSTMVANPYTDPSGHGTHVAGILAGKTYGWAKNARIYVIPAAVTGAPNALDQFSAIKSWHISKNGSRPTVVNMSWGYFLGWRGLGDLDNSTSQTMQNLITAMNNFVSTISGGSHRGDNYTGNSNLTNGKGLLVDTNSSECRNSFLNGIFSYSTQIREALGYLIEAGIIVVHAAGNSSYKIDKPDNEGGSGDYNNYVDSTSKGRIYYHRGGNLSNPGAICVGNIDSTVYSSNLDQKAIGSCTGPGIDIYAAGTSIMSAVSNVNTTSPSYFLNTNYKQGVKGGTSMASPQIAGMCALYLQKFPTATPSEVKAWLKTNATNNLYSAGVIDYDPKLRSLLGGSAVSVAYQNIQETTTTKSYAKDSTGTWRQAQAVWVKHSDGTWKKATVGWIKTSSGWQKTYQV